MDDAGSGRRLPPLPRQPPINWRDTHRLIPSRYPTVGPFDRVASADDLQALFELFGREAILFGHGREYAILFRRDLLFHERRRRGGRERRGPQTDNLTIETPPRSQARRTAAGQCAGRGPRSPDMIAPFGAQCKQNERVPFDRRSRKRRRPRSIAGVAPASRPITGQPADQLLGRAPGPAGGVASNGSSLTCTA
jgi:hypothetical protein